MKTKHFYMTYVSEKKITDFVKKTVKPQIDKYQKGKEFEVEIVARGTMHCGSFLDVIVNFAPKESAGIERKEKPDIFRINSFEVESQSRYVVNNNDFVEFMLENLPKEEVIEDNKLVKEGKRTNYAMDCRKYWIKKHDREKEEAIRFCDKKFFEVFKEEDNSNDR